jgi:hypothetical protein
VREHDRLDDADPGDVLRGRLHDDGGLAVAFVERRFWHRPEFTLWFRYDDVTGGIQRFRWENRGGGIAHIVVTAPAVFATPQEFDIGPGEEGTQSVPGSLRAHITKGALEDGTSLSLAVSWEPLREE